MEPIVTLREMGFRVHQFTEYHFLVNGQFDFWLPRGKWHDRKTGERGRKPLDQIPFFVASRLERNTNAENDDQEQPSEKRRLRSSYARS